MILRDLQNGENFRLKRDPTILFTRIIKSPTHSSKIVVMDITKSDYSNYRTTLNDQCEIIVQEDMNMKTREEVLASIKKWPVNTDNVNAPDGWSWVHKPDCYPHLQCNVYPDQKIYIGEWETYNINPATAEQPQPHGKGDPILGMVLADLTNRALEGNKKYGEPLKAHNGRDALWDAYQEALDLAMYLRQAIEEQRK